MLTVLVAISGIILLGLEWRKRGPLPRIGAAGFALAVLLLAPTMPWRAARRALDAPAAERLTTWPGSGRPVSEYESGVLTMHRMVVADAQIGARARAVGVSMLVWLALSPALRGRRPDPSKGAAMMSAPVVTTDAGTPGVPRSSPTA